MGTVSQSKLKKPAVPEIYLNGILMNGDRIEWEIRKHLKTEQSPVAHIDDKCSVCGDGLLSGLACQPNIFRAETIGDFDKSKLDVMIKGPRQKPIRTEVKMLRANCCQYTYWPRKNGVYTLYISWNGAPLAGSPFSVLIY